jgi:hypothetical protein
MMAAWFGVSQDDRLKVQSGYESEVNGQIRLGRHKGVPSYAAIIMLQNQIAGLEDRIVALQGQIESHHDAAISAVEERVATLESIPRVTEVGSAGGRVNAGQAPTAIKRMGRADRPPFGWRLHPRDDKKLLPDREEQDTIHQARLLRSYGLSLREVCRRLDQQGRGRRGKKWEESHSILRAILLHNKQP